VAVEKLALHEIAEIASRQEALQTIFSSLLDIFYHPIFDYYQKNRLFQQPQGHFPTVAIRFGPLALPGLLLLSIALEAPSQLFRRAVEETKTRPARTSRTAGTRSVAILDFTTYPQAPTFSPALTKSLST
jgi:hypothetical protein